MQLYRPVKWIRGIDRKLTQWFWEDPTYYQTIGRPYHLGLDYAHNTAWFIQAIYAAEDWLVALSWWDASWFWNLIKIQWESWTTYYAHLSALSVKKWDYVKANQQIWLSWNTGNSKWVHLHFWWKPADKSLRNRKDRWDPTPYIVDWITRDPLVDRLVKDWYRNWVEGGWVTERIALLVAKTKYT
jgi:murein DD-endopeptidase MepM/ murein hydrolase activator NlpD